MKKTVGALFFLFWLTLTLAIFYGIQKPDFFQVVRGIGNTVAILSIPLLMAGLSACIGSLFIHDGHPMERLTIGTAGGLGVLGLTGFFLAAMGWAKAGIILSLFVILLAAFLYTGKVKQVWSDIRSAAGELSSSLIKIPKWIPVAVGTGLALTILLGLAPPIEDFDAMLYHLAVPALWLRDGGLSLVNMPHYWFPQIVEGLFVWPLIFGYDTAAHLIHFLWLLLIFLLAWHWTRSVWGNSIAWNGLLLLLSMPSLLWLASWAYTDYALTFASLATAYTIWKWKITDKHKWLFLSGVMAGLAVSVKYTGFIIPLAGILLILFWGKDLKQRVRKVFYFGMICTFAASPWYIRNWIWVGNPIYPFVFGGRFWDSFLAQAYSASGTGIGLDPVKLLSLPFTTTLGIYDANYFDGRIGPFFLILSPLVVWIFWYSRHEPDERKYALQAIGGLGALGILSWLAGVINSASLFQSRLLFPVLIPLVIPTAIGLEWIRNLDAPRLKISFIARIALMLVVLVNLVDFSLQIIVRNPLAVSLGMVSRQAYIEMRQPGYAAALTLVNNLPENTKVYSLFEPRSYGMTINIQPDAINANFLHDVWLYQSPDQILNAWRKQGYTYILLSRTGAEYIHQNEEIFSVQDWQTLDTLLSKLPQPKSIGGYELYSLKGP